MTNNLYKLGVISFSALGVIACVLASSLAYADGYDLSKIGSPRTLKAIAYADNGKAVGMKVTLGKNTLAFKALKGTFDLGAVGRFDINKMEPSYKSVYKNADGAFIYAVRNWEEMEEANKSNIHFSGHQAPKYVYIYTGKYKPTGQSGIFVCTIIKDNLQGFFSTASGHGRCDVFQAT